MQPSHPSLALLAAVVLAGGLAPAQSTRRVSVSSSGVEANGDSGHGCVSADGRIAGFLSNASNLVPGDTNGATDVFVHDLATGMTTRVNVDSRGAEANSYAGDPALSGDGRYVAFYSPATNLVPGDTNGAWDAFVHDRLTGRTSRVSLGPGGAQSNGNSSSIAISQDGRCVGFTSSATNLVPGDTNGVPDIFVHDRTSGITRRVSVDSSGAQANDASHYPSLSEDGRVVAFVSYATNLVAADTNAQTDVFVHDVATGITTRENVSSTGAEADAGGRDPTLSADARSVAFSSSSSNLVPGGTPVSSQVYVHDRLLGQTRMVSLTPAGEPGFWPSGAAGVAISADGRFVSFGSAAHDLVVGDDNNAEDIFVRDLAIGVTRFLNVGSNGQQTPDGAGAEDWFLSADGSVGAFLSSDRGTVPGDTNGKVDVFVHDFGSETIGAWCFGDGTSAPCPCGNSGARGRGCDNSQGTGGARLAASGARGLSSDSLVLTSSGEPLTAYTVFFQGRGMIAPLVYGDGLRCAGSPIERLYAKVAAAGVATAPQAGDPSISARSGEAGDPLALGSTRHYQAYYRDTPAFCPPPAGNSWNASNALSVTWGP